MAPEREKWSTLMGGDRNVELLLFIFFPFSPSPPPVTSHPPSSPHLDGLGTQPLTPELFGLGLIYGVNSARSVQ